MYEQARDQLHNLYKMFVELDLLQLEVNPWAIDPNNNLICIDSKITVDDNAKFRQQELVRVKKESLGSEQTDEFEEEVCSS
jgi:succinyl-CoA synthetase beta subunit